MAGVAFIKLRRPVDQVKAKLPVIGLNSTVSAPSMEIRPFWDTVKPEMASPVFGNNAMYVPPVSNDPKCSVTHRKQPDALFYFNMALCFLQWAGLCCGASGVRSYWKICKTYV